VSTEPDDASLVRAARAGDALGLGMLLERHRAVLQAVAVGILGCSPAAEDAVQETFLIALSRIGQLRDPTAARGWLLAILKNQCRAQVRRQQPYPEADIPEPVDEHWVDEAIERAVLRDWVAAALNRLSEPLRLVTMLRFFSEASSYEAIAQICGIPVGTVRSRLSSARSKLAVELLATTAGSDSQVEANRRRAGEYASAMADFERTGAANCLRNVLSPDLRFRLGDGPEQVGYAAYMKDMVDHFDDGLRTSTIRVTAGANVTVVDVRLISPAGAREPCPPFMTQVQFNDDRWTTNRIRTHYGEVTSAPSNAVQL
jgi:RNA polymerase sigma-70 factor (ECF subfamily)